MFKTIKNAFKTPEVRKRILYTVLLIVLFRFGCFITVPGVDTVALGEFRNQASSQGLTGLIDLISGKAFSNKYSKEYSKYETVLKDAVNNYVGDFDKSGKVKEALFKNMYYGEFYIPDIDTEEYSKSEMEYAERYMKEHPKIVNQILNS